VIGAVGTIVGIVAVVLIARTGGGANAHATPSSTVVATTGVVTGIPTATATATVAPAASVAAPVLHEVLISVVPVDAALMRDGKDLGGSPVALHLAEGESVRVVITRKGYKPKTVTIDGTDSKVTVMLDSAFGPPPRGGGGAPAVKPPAGGIDDVGDPFAKKGH
jgi:hypothetical protein